jgi:hypothetical protein
MIQKNFRAVVVVMASILCASGVLPHAQNGTPSASQQPNPNHPAKAPAGTVPPELQPGIASLVSAKASLEQAGSKWGGHRVKAIGLIDKALKACGQTQTHTAGEMKSGSTDDAAAMQAGTTELTNAQTVFKNSKNKWGGKTAQVLTLINESLQELQLATNAANKPKKSS